jgi:hypothetical protein
MSALDTPAGAPTTVGSGPDGSRSVRSVACPFGVRVDRLAAFLNTELRDHPIYEGIELQWFDDPSHGTGMLVFLQRRVDRRVDYYVDPALRLDPASYQVGGGTGVWTAVDFEEARLTVDFEGVDAEVRFTDVDGRLIELRVDDRAAGTGRRGVLLAPFGDGVEQPTSLLLVYVHGFDLVRRVAPAPLIRIDGAAVRTGQLPGAALHRRHLIKYGGPLTVAVMCPATDGPVPVLGPEPGTLELGVDGRSIASFADRRGGGAAQLAFDPPVPDLRDLGRAYVRAGRWHVDVDDVRITGGTWSLRRRPDDRVELELDVTERWEPPPGLPPLMRIVTRVVPTFRRWPTTYRWRAEVTLGAHPTMTSGWARTGGSRGEVYRRLTRS